MKWSVNDPWVFYGISALILGYLLYMIVRKRKGERPGTAIKEPEL